VTDTDVVDPDLVASTILETTGRVAT